MLLCMPWLGKYFHQCHSRTCSISRAPFDMASDMPPESSGTRWFAIFPYATRRLHCNPIYRFISSSTPPGDGTTTASPQTPSWAIRFRASGSRTPSLGKPGFIWRSERRHQLAWRCQNLVHELPAAQTFRLEATAWFRSTNKCRHIERTGETKRFCHVSIY